MMELYRQTSPTSVELFPEVRPVLEAARRRGFSLGLVTDNPPDAQRLKLALSGLADLFDATVFTRELGVEKPDSSGFAAAAEAMGLDPACLVSVGDNPFRDAEGSLRAGYDAAFWVRRRASAVNPSDAAVEELLGPRFERVRVVPDLRAMLAQLSLAREPTR
jgi:putative hydrolase of the HAD superfamily